MSIVDNFYLLAHDENGKPRVQARVAALGLAASVLAELMLTGHVTIAEQRVQPTAPPMQSHVAGQRYTPPPDPLGHTVWDQIRHEPNRHQVRTWLGVLAPTITEAVAVRLVRIGALDQVEVGRFRRTTRYVPIDRNAGVKIKAVLASRLIQADPTIGWSDAVLAGVLHATGLMADVLWQDSGGRGRRYLGEILRDIGAQTPAFIDLFADTEAAVGDAVLSHRV